MKIVRGTRSAPESQGQLNGGLQRGWGREGSAVSTCACIQIHNPIDRRSEAPHGGAGVGIHN